MYTKHSTRVLYDGDEGKAGTCHYSDPTTTEAEGYQRTTQPPQQPAPPSSSLRMSFEYPPGPLAAPASLMFVRAVAELSYTRQ
jgi:hypothetical protein